MFSYANRRWSHSHAADSTVDRELLVDFAGLHVAASGSRAVCTVDPAPSPSVRCAPRCFCASVFEVLDEGAAWARPESARLVSDAVTAKGVRNACNRPLHRRNDLIQCHVRRALPAVTLIRRLAWVHGRVGSFADLRRSFFRKARANRVTPSGDDDAPNRRLRRQIPILYRFPWPMCAKQKRQDLSRDWASPSTNPYPSPPRRSWRRGRVRPVPSCW
jgi:hypothetical protein